MYNKSIIYWLASGCILIFLMVIIGGITRLTGSGLSITEWKVITGTIPPLSEETWIVEFEKYKQIPQFQLLNSSFTLADYKYIYFWEYLHRLIGRMVGLVFLIPFIYFYSKKLISRDLLPSLLIMLCLGALQGVVGWYMVSSGLTQNTKVSHWRLAMHLGLAFITFGYIYYTYLKQYHLEKRRIHISKVNYTPLIILCIVFLQILFGALVAGSHAGYIYNTWPDMEGNYFPEAINYALQHEGWMCWFNNIVCIQFLHRNLAYLIVCLLTALLYHYIKKKTVYKEETKALFLIVYIVIVQAILGILTLLAHIPVFLAVLHQVTAFMLFAACIRFYFISNFPETVIVKNINGKK